MQIVKQFGLKKTLDHLIQLIYISTNILDSFDYQNDISFLRIDQSLDYSESELNQLLTYFLDLIEFFTHERVRLTQDPVDSSCFALSGGY
ncbi:MAG: hypothetical protein JSV04_06130 [Candidatus Heimdallarchaeota archaeon]|nr:MAG: hypothetical protein JSV04_06130 [Candidatus Heimdallarchaeota archaeon]